MFISFDLKIAAADDADSWVALTPTVRKMLHAFEYRRHMFYFTMGQIASIQKYCELGKTELALIELFLNKRNDFHQWYSSSQCHLVVCRMDEDFEIICGDAHELRVSPGKFLGLPIIEEGYLLAENIANDARWYRRLATLLAPRSGLEGLVCGLTPAHGGGADIGGYFENAVIEPRVHYCIIDADRPGQWKPYGDSARILLRKCIQSGCMSETCQEMSGNLPLFGISALPMRQCTNSIPPNMIHDYYTRRDVKPSAVEAFRRIFPNFPHLNDEEWLVWTGLNFENLPDPIVAKSQFEGQVSSDLMDRLTAEMGREKNAIIPKKTTARLLEWERDSIDRFDLRATFEEALRTQSYLDVMGRILKWPLHLGAAYGNTIT